MVMLRAYIDKQVRLLPHLGSGSTLGENPTTAQRFAIRAVTFRIFTRLRFDTLAGLFGSPLKLGDRSPTIFDFLLTLLLPKFRKDLRRYCVDLLWLAFQFS